MFTIGLTSGQIQIDMDLIITGPADSKIAISGSNVSRVFDIVAGTVSISNLTITQGSVIGADGVSGTMPSGVSVQGGGARNAAFLTLTNCSLTANKCVGGAGWNNQGGSGQGGAGENAAVVQSTIQAH